jgi:ribosomal RNA assembly protein
MEEEIIRIPAERIKVLLGKEGKTKELIEKKCKIKIRADREGEVSIKGESADVFFAKDVIIAIGRGFNPAKALKLIKPDYQFYLFRLKEYLPTEKAIKRIKGRIIGEDGKMKEEIERATDSHLSIYGNSVGVISKIDSIIYAQEVVEMLINGAKHASAYRYLAKAKRRIMESRLKGE